MFDSPDLKILSRYVRSYLAGLKSLRVEVDREECRYLDGGKGDTIIFLHGTAGSKTEWRSLMQEYREDYRVIAIDVPGLCISLPFRHRKHSLRQLGQWLGCMIEQLRLGKVHIMAASMGCTLGAYFAASQPERVKSLTLLGFPFQLVLPPQKPESLLQEFREAFYVDSVEGLQALYRRAYFKAPTLPTIVLRYNLREIRQYRESVLQVLKEVLESAPVMVAGLRQIRVPTLVLHGDTDRVCEAQNGEFWHLHIPQARFHIIPECGHMPHIEKPEEVLQQHRMLLRAVDTRSRLRHQREAEVER